MQLEPVTMSLSQGNLNWRAVQESVARISTKLLSQMDYPCDVNR